MFWECFQGKSFQLIISLHANYCFALAGILGSRASSFILRHVVGPNMFSDVMDNFIACLLTIDHSDNKSAFLLDGRNNSS